MKLCTLRSFMMIFVLVSIHGSLCGEEDAAVLVYRPTEHSIRDFSEMKKLRIIRVLVSHSMTHFFIDAGKPRGFEYEMMHEYEKYLNRGNTRKDREIHLVFIPLVFQDLIPALNEGVGDIVAAGMTVTKEREGLVSFTDSILRDVSEIVVTSKGITNLESLDDLSGCRVHVKRGSSYGQHLKELNSSFRQRGLESIDIAFTPEYLVTEDILELVNAGIIELTVADRHIAEIWSAVFTDMKVRTDLVVNTGGRIAWAVRKDNHDLLAHLNGFVKVHRKGTLLGNIFFKRYFENTRWIEYPFDEEEQKRMLALRGLFEKYGKMYRFDWLLVAAQAFQESGMDQKVRSPAGAVGIMQLLPSTSEYLGISSIENKENNIHAGIKYMDYL
ncbi:MAG: MltF family protein, partial [Planctomycetota bacterium]